MRRSRPYWPEFAANGKDRRARPPRALALGRSARGRGRTSRSTRHWPGRRSWTSSPGRRRAGSRAPPVGYHMRTYGWLVGELVRRDHRHDARDVLPRRDRRRRSGSTGGSGCPSRRRLGSRRSSRPQPATDPEVRALMDAVMAPGTMLGDALTGPAGHFHYDEMWNTRARARVRAAVVERHRVRRTRSSRMYAALVGPVDAVRAARRGRGRDARLRRRSRAPTS